VSLAYAAEQQIDRLIEENDGHRVVELRHFVRSRNAKLLCNVEDVRISLGAPGQYLLGMLDSVLPGTTGVVDTVQPIAESILSYGTDAAVRDAASKAVAYVDTLAGKKVRITYEDGLGVTGIEPVGCTLDGDEMDYISATAVLSDCYIWDLKKAPGETWSVDAAQLAPLIDPTLRGIASGEVRFIRDPDSDEGGRRQATLRIESGSVQVNASDDANRRISGFSPRGVLRYGLDSKVVEFAKLLGDLSIEEVSTDHILFESSFKTQPKLSVEYTCTVR
jgi:hypothetical protein